MKYTIFDVETTGLNPQAGDRIIEIAAVQMENDVIDEENAFVSLVNPRRPIPPESTEVTKITDSMVADAPFIEEVLPKFLEYIKDTTLIAHNAEFDMGFLRTEMKNCHISQDLPKHLCTMEMSKNIFSFQTLHNLDIVMFRMKVEATGDRHRALTDVLATAEVLKQFKKYRPEVIDG